uniref:Uncharacterized protein n=1 Tax=Rhizophora mucronata TaxID=61149 RepID=A0A2P2NV63_RHIMU
MNNMDSTRSRKVKQFKGCEQHCGGT